MNRLGNKSDKIKKNSGSRAYIYTVFFLFFFLVVILKLDPIQTVYKSVNFIFLPGMNKDIIDSWAKGLLFPRSLTFLKYVGKIRTEISINSSIPCIHGQKKKKK